MNVLHAPTYQWTVEEYEKLGEAGIFHENDRVELLNGDIIIMSPIGYRHAQAVTRLTNFFARRSSGRFDVSPQNPFNLDPHSQPQPDICLLDPRAAQLKSHPSTDLIFLVIEVSDSSVRYDRGDKRPAYARQGVREFWLLNLEDNVLEVYRHPSGESFTDGQILQPEETIAPLAFPDLQARVSEFLP
jgi:hypothetical protein